ncbi:Uncharacterised protein [Klebsiella pneumoniae]|nr:Uncharacterised protein [Klebsiella pneumoniae]
MRGLVLLRAVVLQDDQPRRLVAALGDGEERAHAQFAQFLLVKDLDLQALELLGQALGLLAEERRMADVRRQVAEIAGQGHAIGDGLSFLAALLDGGAVGLVGEQGQLLQFQRLGFLALVAIEHVQAIGQGFHQQTRLRVGIAAFHREIAEGQRGIGAGQALEGRQHGGGQLAVLAVAQFALLAGADQQHALGLEIGQALQEQGLADLAGQVATLEHCADGAAGGVVDRLGAGAELAAFAYGEHQGGGFQGFRAYAFNKEFHGRGPQYRQSGWRKGRHPLAVSDCSEHDSSRGLTVAAGA